MILIEQFALSCFHLSRIYTFQIKWDQSQWLKFHKLAVGCFFSFFADYKIFVTDAEFIFRIISRFIGGDHSFFQNRSRKLGRAFPAEALRSFVYIEKITYAMACSVVIILSHSPERSSGQCIQIQAGTAVTEFCCCQVQVSTEYCCEIFFFFFSNRAKYNGAGDISGALQIMSACIHQNQPFWLQWNIGFFCCTVMDNGSMCTVGNDGIKAVSLKILLYGTEFIELISSGKLGDLLHSHIFLQPVDKLHHCNAIFEVGSLFILDFGFIFDGFWEKGQIFTVQDRYLLRNTADQPAVYIASRKIYLFLFGDRLYIGVNIIIWINGNTVFGKCFLNRIRKGFFIGKKTELAVIQHKIGKNYRAAVDIISADI